MESPRHPTLQPQEPLSGPALPRWPWSSPSFWSLLALIFACKSPNLQLIHSQNNPEKEKRREGKWKEKEEMLVVNQSRLTVQKGDRSAWTLKRNILIVQEISGIYSHTHTHTHTTTSKGTYLFLDQIIPELIRLTTDVYWASTMCQPESVMIVLTLITTQWAENTMIMFIYWWETEALATKEQVQG